MTESQTTSPPWGKRSRAKLPILDTVGATYRALWALRDDLLRVAAIPALASFGIYMLLQWKFGVAIMSGNPMHPPELSVGAFLVMLLAWLPMTLFAVNWTRVLLLGREAVKGLGLRWGLRETIYVVRALAIFLAAMLAGLLASLPFIIVATVIALAAGVFGAVAGPDMGASPAVGILLGMLAAVPMLAVELYVVFRLLLALPAAALDRSRGFRLSWATTRGTVLRLLAAYLLVVIPLYVVIFVVQWLSSLSGVSEVAPFSTQMIATLLVFIGAAAGSSVLAIAYRRLVGVAPAA